MLRFSLLDARPEWQDTRSLSQTECQFGKLSFFNNAAYRGSLCKLFSSGSTSRCGQTVITLRVSAVQPLERFVGLVPESINLGDLVRTGLCFPEPVRRSV